MQALGLADNLDTFNTLVAAYAEKSRHYHTGAHINACLIHFDTALHLAQQPSAVELALWFHDAIYKPRSSTNEADSANWCKEFLRQNQALEEVVHKVHRLIMATCHNALTTDSDEQLVVDIDLAILGAPKDIYQAFELNIRKEYRWVPGFIFRAKRKQILQQLLQRKRIYHHSFFYDRLETQARDNLDAAIAHF